MNQKSTAPSLFLRRIAGGIVTGHCWIILILTLPPDLPRIWRCFWA